MAEERVQEEKRYAYRLPPCPPYDVEGIESWLSAMAAKGLVLTKDGRFMGLGIFEKTAPCALRYRLEASPKQIAALDTPAPEEEAEDLYAAYGWEYMGAWGQFFVYCTTSEDAREPNTDPKVQAIALRQLRKRELSHLFAMVFYWVILFLLKFPFRLCDRHLYHAEPAFLPHGPGRCMGQRKFYRTGGAPAQAGQALIRRGAFGP